ncbi:helix-turn-helix domain-containing protein [Streptomyces sp. NPDC051907]|uniref:helix-turn-helix domain-containing protein n=1 Tax=Streptomyces sp. NPDC051907 TaxID=3155284 RepID=UPI0034437903
MEGGRRVGAAVAIDSRVRERLVRTVTSAKSEVRAVLRARDRPRGRGRTRQWRDRQELEVSVDTVRKWRGRFAALGPDGLRDAERSGRPKICGHEVRVAIVATAASMPPHPEVTWSPRAVAQHVALWSTGWEDSGRCGEVVVQAAGLAE